MNIEMMQQIITMVGSATESAVMIAVLWLCANYLITLVGWLVTAYIIKFIANKVYDYLTVDVTKEDHLDNKAELERVKGRLQTKDDEFYSKRDIQNEKHKIELEKVKHLYKILKDSSDVK